MATTVEQCRANPELQALAARLIAEGLMEEWEVEYYSSGPVHSAMLDEPLVECSLEATRDGFAEWLREIDVRADELTPDGIETLREQYEAELIAHA